MPCSRLIVWLIRIGTLWFVVAPLAFFGPMGARQEFIVVSVGFGILNILATAQLFWCAYLPPLHVLRDARKILVECTHDISDQFEKEANFAICVIRKSQVAILFASLSMVVHLAAIGSAWMNIPRGWDSQKPGTKQGRGTCGYQA